MELPKYYLLNGELGNFKSGLSQSDILLNWIPGTLVLKWRASGTRIPFYNAQYHRLKQFIESFCTYSFSLPKADEFKSMIIKLIQRNRLFKGVELRYYFKPAKSESDNFDILILSFDHPDEQFELNEQGLMIGQTQEASHPGQDILFQSESKQFMLDRWIRQAHERELDQLFFVGDENQLLETTEANIYLIKGRKVFTPLNHDTLNPWGIKDSIQNACTKLALSFSSTSSLRIEHLNQADEVFLGDDYHGIRWVMGHQHKRFFRKNSKKIIDLINLDWKNDL